MLAKFIYAALAALATTTSGVTAQVEGDAPFVIHSTQTLMVARIDPIVNPGKVAGHVHTIFGASNFRDVINTPEEAQQASCSTAVIQGDKSNYWAPTLYFRRKDGKMEPITHGARVYYFVPKAGAEVWPPGMRIITGTAMQRDLSDIRTRGIDIKSPNEGAPSGFYLPNKTSHAHVETIAAGIHFPSCGWANQSLDSWDHFSHLTWPIETGGGKIWQVLKGTKCPESHPIKYPAMFMQMNYYLNDEQKADWGTHDNNVLFSNGDALGPSFHADFINGWAPEVLKAGVSNCIGVNDDLQNCPQFKASGLDILTMNNCRMQGMIPDENVGYLGGLEELPGCNPIWTADMGDQKPNDCPNRKPDPGWTPPNALYSWAEREATVPVAAPVDVLSEGDDFSNITLTHPQAGLSPWGQDKKFGRYAAFLNKDTVQVGTAQDVADNLDGNTAVFKRPEVKGMQDTSEYTAMTPSHVVGEEAWKVRGVPSGEPTHIPGNPVGEPVIFGYGNPDPAGLTNTPAATATPSPSASDHATTPEAPVANGTDSAPATPTSGASESPAASAESPAASAEGSSTAAAESASASPSVQPSAIAAPGGANNLVAGADEEGPAVDSASASPSASASAVAPADDGYAVPSASASPSVASSAYASASAAAAPKPSGGKNKCKRRRRRANRLGKLHH